MEPGPSDDEHTSGRAGGVPHGYRPVLIPDRLVDRLEAVGRDWLMERTWVEVLSRLVGYQLAQSERHRELARAFDAGEFSFLDADDADWSVVEEPWSMARFIFEVMTPAEWSHEISALMDRGEHGGDPRTLLLELIREGLDRRDGPALGAAYEAALRAQHEGKTVTTYRHTGEDGQESP